MKDIIISTSVKVCSPDELTPEDRQLIDEAIAATAASYAPYSKFCVGACLRLTDGTLVHGANQENAAFPSGLCAERSALFAAGAQYPDLPVDTLAIAARNEQGLTPQPISPCGACRQVMLETEERYGHDFRVLLYGTEAVYIVESAKALLPLCFTDSSMR